MFIENKNVVIRSAIIDDSRILADWWNDGNVMAHAGFPNGLGTTEEECDFSYQNKGLGTLILNMLIHYLFTDTVLNSSIKIEKITLDTNAKNLRSHHVYEKLGFRKVATNIDAWKDQLGEWQTSIDYEMTLDDYNELNK